MKYTLEYIEHVKQYPYEVNADYRNGVKDNIIFTAKRDALNFIEREQVKHKRAKYTLLERTLTPEYL